MGSTSHFASARQKLPTEHASRLSSAGLPATSPSVHLDALRGFAAFSVLLSHWRDAFFVDYPVLHHHNLFIAMAYVASGLGHQWVIVFFVMSGYLVGGSVLRSAAAGRWSWRSYLLARLTRLYIVLLPALALGAVLDQAGMHAPGTNVVYSGNSGMHALSFDVHATSRPLALAENMFFLQTIVLPGRHGQTVPTFGSNGALWSLCNEFWYYLAFPLLVLLVAAPAPWWTRTFCGLGLVTWGWFVGWSIALLGIPWLMGAGIVFLPPLRIGSSIVRGIMIAAALGLLGAGLVLGKHWGGSIVSDLVLGVAVTFLFWVTLHCATAPVPGFYTRLARRAARSSYTLYLVHLPLVVFIKAVFHLPRFTPGVHSFAIAAAILICVLIYAQLVYEVFEKNTDRVRKWIKPLVLGSAAA